MPFPSEHSGRLISPDKFDEKSFRRKNIANGIDMILGKLKGESSMTTQAIRFKKDKFTPEEAKKWLKEHDYKMMDFEAAMMTEDVEIKILKAGTFTSGDGNEYKFTDADLAEIADTYNSQTKAERHDAPLIPDDHEEADSEGQPKTALGFVKELTAKGSDLFAKIMPTPELVQKVKDNAYKKVSAMFYPDNKLLRHVAILGAVVPAVKGLGMLEFAETGIEDLKEYKFEEAIPVIDEKKEEEQKQQRLFADLSNNYFIKFMEGDMPTPIDAFQVEFIKKLTEATSSDIGTKAQGLFEELKPTFFKADAPAEPPAPAAAEPEQKFTESPEFKAEKTKREELEAKISKLEKENRAMKFGEYVDGQKKRLLPAQRTLVVSALEMGHQHNEAIMFAEGDKQYHGEELIKAVIESFPENPESVKMFSEFARPDEAFNKAPDQKKLEDVHASVEAYNKKKQGK